MISGGVITPGAKRGEMALELQGMAGILALTRGQENKGEPFFASSTLGGCGGSLRPRLEMQVLI
jgi:hypothetical protein